MATSNKDKNKTQAPQEEPMQEKPAENEAQAQKTPDPEIEALKAQVAALTAELKAAKEAKAAEPEPEEVSAEEPAEKPVDEWEIYEEVYVPRHGKGQEQSFYISVNDRSVQIPADGKYHQMRKPFAEALRMSLEAEAESERYADEVPHDAAPASFEQLMSVINDLKNKLREHGID